MYTIIELIDNYQRTEKPRQVHSDRFYVEEADRPPKVFIGSDRFKKSKQEKALLKEMKANHNATLIEAGYSPKKRLNLSEPMTFKSNF